MTHVSRPSQLRIAVSLTAKAVAVELRDRRCESIGLFDDLDEVQREQLALDAWTIGLRALHNADIESRIEDELSRLEKLATCSDAIRRNVDGISEEVRKVQHALDRALRTAQSALRALRVEADDEAVVAGSPIELPNSSLRDAVHSLPGEGGAP